MAPGYPTTRADDINALMIHVEGLFSGNSGGQRRKSLRGQFKISKTNRSIKRRKSPHSLITNFYSVSVVFNVYSFTGLDDEALKTLLRSLSLGHGQNSSSDEGGVQERQRKLMQLINGIAADDEQNEINADMEIEEIAIAPLLPEHDRTRDFDKGRDILASSSAPSSVTNMLTDNGSLGFDLKVWEEMVETWQKQTAGLSMESVEEAFELISRIASDEKVQAGKKIPLRG